MTGDVVLSPAAAEVANRVVSIDRELDRIRHRTETAVESGLRAGAGGLGSAQRAEQVLDERKDALLRERAALVARLQRLTGVGPGDAV